MAINYNVKAHPTKYSRVLFRSRLEARWAAFFDLISWKWEYEPIDLVGWTPDFRISWYCKHSECDRDHTLLVEVKPYYSIREFEGHPCLNYPFGGYGDRIPEDASAAFGANPGVTYWAMSHGAGGGEFDIPFWIHDWEVLWKEAGNFVQWRGRQRQKRR